MGMGFSCGGCGKLGVNQEQDPRNVLDVYKYWHTDCIKKILDMKRNPMVVVFESISGDFNLSTGIRNANNFAAAEVWIVGKRRWDKRGAVGTHHYEHIKYAETIEECYRHLRTRVYHIFACDNVDGSRATTDIVSYPPRSAFVFGEEQRGLSASALSLADSQVYIKTNGSARSLNVGTTSGIMMYDYTTKNGF